MISVNADYFTEHDLIDMGIAKVGTNVRISCNCTLVGLENIEIGSNVRIDANCIMTTSADTKIVLGNYVHIGSHCVILASSGFRMDDFSGLSHGVLIFTESDDFSGEFLFSPVVPKEFTHQKSGEVVLERYVIIGAGAVIMPKVLIKEGAAVGALSFVRKTLDEWTIYSGNPLKRVSSRKKGLIGKARTLISNNFF